MKLTKSKWNKELDKKTVDDFVRTHKPNVWYETAYDDICMVVEDYEEDPFLIRMTDTHLGIFEIITNFTYLTFDINDLMRIHSKVKKSFYKLKN